MTDGSVHSKKIYFEQMFVLVCMQLRNHVDSHGYAIYI